MTKPSPVYIPLLLDEHYAEAIHKIIPRMVQLDEHCAQIIEAARVTANHYVGEVSDAKDMAIAKHLMLTLGLMMFRGILQSDVAMATVGYRFDKDGKIHTPDGWNGDGA